MRLGLMFVLFSMLVLPCLACDDGGGTGGDESVNSESSASEEGDEAADITVGPEDVADEPDDVEEIDVNLPEEDVVEVPMEPTFTGVMTHVVVPYCAACHTTADVDKNGGLDFETEDVYSQLVDVQAVEAPAKIRVVPGDPDNSFLVQKLENTQGFFEGDVMPPPPSSTLDPELIQLVRDWIADGAQDN